MPNRVESPLTEGEIFDPKQEITSIVESGGPYAAEKVETFKQKLEFQASGLAKLESDVVSAVEENLRISRMQLMELLDPRAVELGMTPAQGTMAIELLGKFMNRHEAVMGVWDRNNQDSADIFKEVFKAEPQGRVDVHIGPSVLFFRCFNDMDYALIHSNKFMNGGKPADEDVVLANCSGGVSIANSLNPALNGALIAENCRNAEFSNESVTHSARIYEHEKKHALNRFFMDIVRSENTFRLMKAAETPEETAYWMEHYLIYLRSCEEQRIADEVLAYSATEDDPEYIVGTLSKKKAEGGLYDYFELLVNGEPGKRPSLEEFLAKVVGDDYLPVIRESIQKVFKTEYREIIVRGLESIRRLEQRGYTVEEASSILGRTPLPEWTKISCRFAAERQFPPNIFHLDPSERVVAIDSGGRLRGEVRLKGYALEDGLPVYIAPKDRKIPGFRKLSTETLEEVNYPFKTPERWLAVWVRAGGDPSVGKKAGLDLSSEQLISADEAWAKFRQFLHKGSNTLSVFNTLRRHLRKAY